MPPTQQQQPQTALELAADIQNGTQTAVKVLEHTLKSIEEKEPHIDALLLVTEELARQTAHDIDEKVKHGDTLPLLAGVPITLKDNILIKNTRTTCASKMLENYIAPYDATVTQKIHQHMMPIVGKANMDEFAMGSSTENSAFKSTKNPWDTTRVPGGSSGGAAAAVSAHMTTLSLGSDTGGSVRQPASLCGIVGIKPTYGTVSRYGLTAFGSSLDQVSPFTRTVKDSAAILQVISGADRLDSTSLLDVPVPDYLSQLTENSVDLTGKTIGIIDELTGDGFQSAVSESLAQAVKTLTELGATVQKVSIPAINHAIAAYYVVATAEASSNLGRFDGVRYGLRRETPSSDLHTMYRQTRSSGFGAEVKRRIMLGTFCLSSGYLDQYYNKAQKVRVLLTRQFKEAFSKVDLLVSPTSPTTAFKLGEKSSDSVQMYLSDIASIPINMAGIPAMSIPCGFDENHLPIGLQLIGPHLGEATLFQVAYAFEQKTGLSNLDPYATR